MTNNIFYRKSLTMQIGVLVAILITSIELVLLFGSYYSEKNKLLNLQNKIEQELSILKTTPELHQRSVLTNDDIEIRLNSYIKNIIALIFIIIFFVSLGTVFIFYHFVGKKIVLLRQLNRQTRKNIIAYYPTELIPNNDLGDVIIDRNKMLRDIEDNKKNLEENLAEAKKSLLHAAKLSTIGEFTSSIAHDLNNPLSVITAGISSVEKNLVDGNPHSALKRLEKVKFAAERITKMVHRMGRFSRKDQSKRALCSLKEIYDNSMVLIENKIKISDITVHYNIPDDVPMVNVNQDLFEQVFMNLLSNGIDALEKQREKIIEINASWDNNVITISLKDNGPGIPVENQERVFSSFYTSKEAGKGTGLGLSIVRQIIAQNNGSIMINADYYNGAEFLITLPIH